MGTKIEYSINPLAASVDSNNNFTDVWEHFQNKGQTNNNCCGVVDGDKSQDPMDKMMLDRNNNNNIEESIKKTMQMHEDIFKHQVKELHRVYSVQKMLMDELKNETRQKKLWTPPQFIQQQQQNTNTKVTTKNLSLPDFQVHLVSKERSGSCSGEITLKKRQRGLIDLEMPVAEENIFAGARSDEAGPSSYMEVDLTLSIGGSMISKKNKKPYDLLPLPLGFSNSSVSFQSDRDCSDPTTPMSSSSVTFDQAVKGHHHHWLSPGLKL